MNNPQYGTKKLDFCVVLSENLAPHFLLYYGDLIFLLKLLMIYIAY